MEIKGFYINFNGQPSVGILDAEWQITGGFSFEDNDELKEFRQKLKEAWEYCHDTPVSIETFEEREKSDKEIEACMKQQQEENEKILTISKVNFTGKWVEFWFKEDHETINGEKDAYHLCSKEYRLWGAVEKAGISDRIDIKGFEGIKIKWIHNGCNWEIAEIVN